MRQAVAVKPSSSPPQPKLQKKFYGSERPMAKEDYIPDLGSSRGQKEKGAISGTTHKSKSTQSQSKSDRSEKSSKGKSHSGKTERNSSKSREKSAPSDHEWKERTKDREDRQKVRERRDTTPVRNVQEFNSSTRFDIDVNEEKRTVTVTPKKVVEESRKSGRTEDAVGESKEGEPKKNPIPNGGGTGWL